MKKIDAALIVSLAAIWGGSYIFIRLAAPTFGSYWLIAFRVLVAGLALLLGVWVMRKTPTFNNRWWHYVLLGTLNAALPFSLITNAVTALNASTAAILNALTPLSTAVVAALWIGDALTPRKLLGIGFGLAGVVVVMGWNPLPLTISTILAAAQSLLATVFYGIGAVYTRVRFKNDTPLALAIAQQLGACALQLPIAAFTPLPQPTPTAIISLIALAIICTSLAYIIYFRLNASLGPSRAMTTVFMVPFFSVLWGVIFLGEPVNTGIALGLLLIVIAIALATYRPRRT